MTRTGRALALATSLALVPLTRVDATPPGSALANEALTLCRLAEGAQESERFELLTSGLEVSEAAVRADTADALAHFAVFCNLGRRVQAAGLSLVRSLEIFRALRALDRAVELAPEDPDVVTAKGALLVSLPRLLGGDADEGEQWLRRALAADPHHCVARWYLADVLARRGGDAEARELRERC